MAIYRRGAIYWWQSSVTITLLVNRPINIRVSLRTSIPPEARWRAAALELARTEIMKHVKDLKPSVAAKDLPKIFRKAFKRELDRIVVAQAQTPELSNSHRSYNTHYARYFTVLAAEPRLLDGELESHAEFMERGLTSDDADSLFLIARKHLDHPAISVGQIARDLENIGVAPTERNMRSVARIVAAGYRNANITASEHLGAPIPASEIWPLPPSIMSAIGKIARGVENSSQTQAAYSSRQGHSRDPEDSATPPEQAEAMNLKRFTISEVAELILEERIEEGSFEPERRRDIRAAIAIFVAANGDVAFEDVRQSHLHAMRKLFPRLPVPYGHKSKDENGGIVQESVAEAVLRGDELRERWRNDPVQANAEKCSYVGLSVNTQRKHLTWLSSIFTHAKDNEELNSPKNLDFTMVRKRLKQPELQGDRYAVKTGKKKNKYGLPWDEGDLARMLEAPIWRGCEDLWRRTTPGSQIIHDGYYWILPLLVCTAARSDEITGLTVTDIFFDVDTPYIHIRPNGLRRIKTDASSRKVPIADRILNLGFREYVEAIRDAGHAAVFPEFENAKMGFDKCFYKYAFEPLRTAVFPAGTQKKMGRKDVDARSIRTTGASSLRRKHGTSQSVDYDKSHRKGLLGHEEGDVTGDIYEDDFEPIELKPMVEHLSTMLPPIERYPIQLRPAKYQKFGRPRGRPKKNV